MAMIWIDENAIEVPTAVADYIADLEIESGRLTQCLDDTALLHKESVLENRGSV